MTAHLLIIYPTPKDAKAFDRAYREEHLPYAGPRLEGATGVTTQRVVGPAFAPPPYYDPKANVQKRIVIAGFNTGDDLPKSRTRVARVMVRVTGNPKYSATLTVASSQEAKPIDAEVSVSEGAAQ